MQKPLTTPRAFFQSVVVPDVDAVKRNPEDVRLALHAATSLHQLRDWVYKAGLVPAVSWQEYCENLYRRCSALRSIRDVASNAKHYPADPSKAARLDIGVTAMPVSTVSEDPDTAQAMQVHVIAKNDSGLKAMVVPAVVEGFEFWKKEFETHGW